MASIFLSHSSKDEATATQVAERLGAEGFRSLFVDFDPVAGIPAGRVWEQELDAQLRSADAVVFVGSPDSVASQWCAVEVAMARSLGKPVFPVLVAGTQRHPRLADVQWVDATTNGGDGWGQPVVDGLRRAGIDRRDSFARTGLARRTPASRLRGRRRGSVLRTRSGGRPLVRVLMNSRIAQKQSCPTEV